MDGATERANRSIGQMFQALITPDQRNWAEKSPLIKFTINASIGNAMTKSLAIVGKEGILNSQ